MHFYCLNTPCYIISPPFPIQPLKCAGAHFEISLHRFIVLQSSASILRFLYSRPLLCHLYQGLAWGQWPALVVTSLALSLRLLTQVPSTDQLQPWRCPLDEVGKYFNFRSFVSFSKAQDKTEEETKCKGKKQWRKIARKIGLGISV